MAEQWGERPALRELLKTVHPRGIRGIGLLCGMTYRQLMRLCAGQYVRRPDDVLVLIARKLWQAGLYPSWQEAERVLLSAWEWEGPLDDLPGDPGRRRGGNVPRV